MIANDIDMQFRDRLREKTQGRPYVFVIMAYKSRYPLFKQIRKAVEEELGYACIRADNMTRTGKLLLPQIHFLIDQAEFVIAEMSENNANVFYEVGYADANGKPILPLIQRGSKTDKKPPSNLTGHLFLKYSDSAAGTEAFNRELRRDLRHRGNHRLELLRDFLLGSNPTPAYIVASPKFPNPMKEKTHRQRPDVRTFSDNIGILGLIRAFGATLGEAAEVHLVSAQWSPNYLFERDYNFYSIGSRKVNPKSGYILAELQRGCAKPWRFGPLPGHSETEGDWQVCLYKPGKKKPCGTKLDANGRFIKEDYGLIIRGPGLKGRVRMVIAGPHSLGTAAACYAATTPSIIERIKKELPSGTLADKTSRFWVLVKGQEDPDDHLLNRNEDRLKIWAGLLS